MAFKIKWAAKAESTFELVIEYLQDRWTEKQVIHFVKETEHITALLSQNPYLFRGSEKEKIHEVLITKHNLLLYQVNEKEKAVELLSFFDTRQDPKKKH